MSEQLANEYYNFVPASVAAREVGYTCDYITRLARVGDIVAKKIGRQWYVDLDTAKYFVQRAALKEAKRKEKLRTARKVEYDVRQKDDRGAVVAMLRAGKHFALLQSGFLALFLMVAMSAGYLSTNERAFATVIKIEIDITPIEELARSFYYFISPGGTRYASLFGVEGGDKIQQTHSYDVTSLSESESLDDVVKGAFSDNVDASFDVEVSNSGVISPEFKTGRGGEYRFKLFLEEISRAQGG